MTADGRRISLLAAVRGRRVLMKDLGDWKGIWVFVEQEERCPAEVSFELLAAAKQLSRKRGGAEIVALLLGHGVKGISQELLTYGADRVLLADHPSLEKYLTLPYTRVVSRLVAEGKPEIFLLPATSVGSDLAARAAIRVNTGLSAHCTHLDINSRGELMQVVPAFGGKVMATILCPKHRPQMATVRPGVYRRGEPSEKRGIIEERTVEILPDDRRQKVIEVHWERKPSRAIEEAEIVVAGGAGIGNREDWKMVEKLGEVLQAAVGGTRPPLDEGWISGSASRGSSSTWWESRMPKPSSPSTRIRMRPSLSLPTWGPWPISARSSPYWSKS
jgi:electron transfer flavoprotein alpha subunit